MSAGKLGPARLTSSKFIRSATGLKLTTATDFYSSLPSKKNTAYADALITRLRLSQECLRHTPGKPNRFDILSFK